MMPCIPNIRAIACQTKHKMMTTMHTEDVPLLSNKVTQRSPNQWMIQPAEVVWKISFLYIRCMENLIPEKTNIRPAFGQLPNRVSRLL